MVAALAEFMRGERVAERLGAPLAEPIFDELAIIGVGLIGSSIARAARRRKAARRIVLAGSLGSAVLERAKALELGDVVTDDLGARGRRAPICVILCAPVGANEAIGRDIAPALEAGRDRLRRRLGQRRGDRRARAASCRQACASGSGPSGRGHRAVRARRRLRDACSCNRWCILTPPEGDGRRGGRAAFARSGRRSGRMSRQ